MKGQAADAIVQLQEAVRLKPNDSVTQGLLAKAQSKH
jgi:Flp pilus assembly protein TadD